MPTGLNYYGQLGFSETIDYILVPEQVMGDVPLSRPELITP